MKFQGLDNKEYGVDVSLYIRKDNDTRQTSSLHSKARKLLKSLYPFDVILEEFILPGAKLKKSLSADFLIPSEKLLVEVHGEQHYKYNTFFYNSKMDFILAKKRDKMKIEWCEINGYILVELPYNESESSWTNRIKDRFTDRDNQQD